MRGCSRAADVLRCLVFGPGPILTQKALRNPQPGVVAQPEPEPELPVGSAENALTSEEGEQVVVGNSGSALTDLARRGYDVQLKDGTDAAALTPLSKLGRGCGAVTSAGETQYSNITGFALSAPSARWMRSAA